MHNHPNPLHKEGLVGRVAPFAAAALLAFIIAPFGSDDLIVAELIAAAAITIAILIAALLLPWERLPVALQVFPPLLYFIAIALARDAGGGAMSGYGPLVMLPVLWLAMYGTGRELLLAIGGAALVFFVPLVLVGGPEYPVAPGLKNAVLWVAISWLVGVTIQRLIKDVRLRAVEPSNQARELVEANSHFDLAFDTAPVGIALAGLDGRHARVNDAYCAMLGRTQQEVIGEPFMTFTHPDDLAADRVAMEHMISGAVPSYQLEKRFLHKSGREISALLNVSILRDVDGNPAQFFALIQDITTLRESERLTAESLSLLETLQSSAPVGFGFVDRDFRLVRMNQALAAINGMPIEEQLGCTVAEVIPSLWSELEPVYSEVLETGQAAVNLEAAGERPGDPGQVHTWLTSLYPVRIEGEVIGIGIIVLDITQRKGMERQLKHMSEHDSLTGIYNRRRLFVELERMLRYSARYGRGGAVLMLDVDNFKWVNDSYGHDAGDHLLISVAQALVGRARETDIVARLGGDEFVVVLPEATEEQAVTFGLQLRTRLSERSIGPPVQVSMGIALVGQNAKMIADDVLIAADIAMYKSKEGGGDQATVYDGREGELLTRVKDLREALAKQRFVLHGQPIVDLHSGRTAHRELLIRMLSDAGETIPPSDFLPIAERFSLVGEIDRWVIGEALILARHEQVSVNLSGHSVGDPEILAAVHEAVAAGLDPCNLMFEITETAVMTDFDRALAFVSALEELGCDLALDDFGTGFGSFTYLKLFPARYLKIDMAFVRDINEDPVDKEIVRSIVGIAHTLGKKTIAEGIENASVLETLRELGVDYGQGFYLGSPKPLVQLATA